VKRGRLISSAEAKTTIRDREVRDFVKAVKQAEEKYGKKIKHLLGLRVYEDTYEETMKLGVEIIED